MKGSIFVILLLNIKRIDTTDSFSLPSLIIFTKGANNSDHDCIYLHLYEYVSMFNIICIKCSPCHLNGNKQNKIQH